jgi:hypothetical protein
MDVRRFEYAIRSVDGEVTAQQMAHTVHIYHLQKSIYYRGEGGRDCCVGK